MPTCYRPGSPAAAVAILLLSSLPTAAGGAAPIALREVCDETTALDLVGVDTARRTALLSLSSRRADIPGWLIEVGDEAAVLYPDLRPGGRLGGSTGPGPVVVLEPCGEGCVQPTSWSGGRWRREGPRLQTASGALLLPVRDGTGAPWVVEHLPGTSEHDRRAVAWRLEDGSWRDAGALDVRGTGSPAAVPDPDTPESLISGTGRFTAGRDPEAWVTMPPVGPEARGSLVPLGEDKAAWLGSDSRLLITRDAGGRWFEQRWTPWSARAGVTRWDRGSDYWLDLPAGSVSGPLPLLWYDDRPGSRPSLWLTAGEGPSDLVSATLPRAPDPGAEPVEEAIHWAGDDWLLLAGCRHDERTAYVLVRRPRGADAGSWERLPLQPGW